MELVAHGPQPRTLVLSLFGAVVLFLVVACTNVASLQLARASGRTRELAVRLALGARRYHVIRQLLTESLVVSAAAGTLGVIAGAWSLDLVVSLLPDGALPRYVQPRFDLRGVLFAAGASLIAGALVAILPVFSATRGELTSGMKHGVRTAGPGLGSLRRLSPQQLLVVAEVALAMTLLSAAGLMVRSIERQLSVDVAFDPAHVVAARMTLPAGRYTPEQRVQFAQRLTERLREIPGVSAAAVATSLPFTGNSNASTLSVDGQTDTDAVQRYYRNSVTPELFSALQIRLVRGRSFTDQDTAGAPSVAIINEAAARRLWPGSEAVGQRIRLGNTSGPAVEIVGVVADARFRDLTTDLKGARVEPDVYFPFAQRPDRDLEIAVRTHDASRPSLAALQQAVAGVDPALPLYAVQPSEAALEQQTSTARFGSWLLAVFSVGALLLSAIGLYGLVTYVVGLSRREIAIRMALGANARRVIGLITGNGLTLVCAGILIGSAGGVLAGRALQSQLFETTAYDVNILAIVSLLMLAAAVAAILIPTRHAVRVDPQTALRAGLSRSRSALRLRGDDHEPARRSGLG